MMKSNISHFSRSFPDCDQKQTRFFKKQHPLQHIQVIEQFLSLGNGLYGHLSEMPRASKQLFVVMDHFTKWRKSCPTPEQKIRTVAQTLVSSLFGRFGPPPQILHSDQRRKLESHVMYEICQIMVTHKSKTAAYHPQCDGQSHTTQEMLLVFLSQLRDDWDTWVSVFTYAYHTSTHASTGFSPYELAYGRTARTRDGSRKSHDCHT